MIKQLIAITIASILLVFSLPASALVTVKKCPTHAPQPIVYFLPAAMQPIYNAETAFDVGMNQTIANAASMAANIQMEAVTNSMMSIMKSLLETSQLSQQQRIEMTREYDKFKMNYKMRLEKEKAELESMLFPGDESMLQPKDSEQASNREISPNSLTFKMIKQVCTAGKMQEMAFSEKIETENANQTFRRGQKITQAITAVSSVNSAAKRAIDMHYGLFCSETDVQLGLCDSPSIAPNADLQALTFFYPQGYKGEGASNDKYYTMYTYSPVESLASTHYIQHTTGRMGVAPPSLSEAEDPRRSSFVAVYKQMVSSLGVASSVMLDIAELREPVNNQGLIMSQLDAVNYLVEETKDPEHRRVMLAASKNGKLLEMQRVLNVQNRIRMLSILQKDNQRMLEATHTAVKNSIYAFSEN